MFSADNIGKTMNDMVETFQTALGSGLQQLSLSVSPKANARRCNREEIRQRIVDKYKGQGSSSSDSRRQSTRRPQKHVTFGDSADAQARNTSPTGWNVNRNSQSPKQTRCTNSLTDRRNGNIRSNSPTDNSHVIFPVDRRNGNVGRMSPTQFGDDPSLTSRTNRADINSTQTTTRDILIRANSLDSTSPLVSQIPFRSRTNTCPAESEASNKEKKYTYTNRLVSYELNSRLNDMSPTLNTRGKRIRSCDLFGFEPNVELTVQYMESVRLLRVVMRQPPNLPGDTRKLFAEVHLSHGWADHQIQKQTVVFMIAMNIKSYKHVCYFTGFSLNEVSKMALEVNVMRRRVFGSSRSAGKAVVCMKPLGDLRSETRVVEAIITKGDPHSSHRV